MALRTARFFGVARSLLIFNSKGSRLARRFGFQLLHLGRKTVIAIIQVFDLLLQLLNLLGKLFDGISLTQYDLNQFVRFIPQGLQRTPQ
jgi:hypothetical protein